MALGLFLTVLTFVGGRDEADADQPPPGALNAAVQLYGPSSSADLQLYAASDEAFAAAFPLLDLYYVVEGAGLPGHNHAMAWDGIAGFDLTKDFNVLLDAQAVILATASDALKYAKAFAQTANAELQLIRQVVQASDSQALGRSIPDPAATLQIDGWEVTLSTWAAENGVLASWSIRFTADRVSQADWRIDGIGVGPLGLRLEGTRFQEGTRLANTYGASGHTLAASQETPSGPEPVRLPAEVENLAWTEMPTTETNFDNSQWVVYYPSDQYPDIPAGILEAGSAYAKGGKHAYDHQVVRNTGGNPACSVTNTDTSNWGFEIQDPDCTNEIFVTDSNALTCGACNARQHPDVKLYVAPYLKEYLNALGYYTNQAKHDVYAVARSVVGHEFFHSIHHVLGLTETWYGFITEGLARFSQTILNPVAEDDPSSLWYGTPEAPNNANGVNYFQLHPDESMCPIVLPPPQPDYPPDPANAVYTTHSYDYGLYWGYLFSKDGGFQTLRDIISRIAFKRQFGQLTVETCDSEVADAITTSLASLPPEDREHVSHADVLADLGIQMHAKDFRWSAPGGVEFQWGTYLLDIKPEPHAYGPTAKPHLVGAWGLQIVPIPLPNQRIYTITYAPGDVGGGTNWRVRIVTKRSGSYENPPPVELQPGQSTTFTPHPANEAAFVETVRQAPSLGTYALTVDPGLVIT